MKSRPVAAALLFAGIAGIAGPASAAEFFITYTGTITSGYDTAGRFGTPDTVLDGKAFTAVYTVTYPGAGATEIMNGFSRTIRGGDQFGGISPVSATITIGGITRTIDGRDAGIATQTDGLGNAGPSDAVYHEVQQATLAGGSIEYGQLSTGVESLTRDFLAGFGYDRPLDYTVAPDDAASGTVSFLGFDGDDPLPLYRAYAELSPTRVTFSSAVPEPATWAMMIMGFGAAGAVLRRRKIATHGRGTHRPASM